MTTLTITAEHPFMSSHSFDTLAYPKKLKAAGVPEQQAEIHAEALSEIVDDKLATKKDLQLLKNELLANNQAQRYKLTIHFGSMLIAAVTVLAVLIKIL